MSRPGYRLIDHTADMAFEVKAPTWSELLARATSALGDILLSLGDEACEEEVPIAVTGADREDVLVAWLNEVAVGFEDTGFHAGGAHVEYADETSARGHLRGRRIDFEREPPDRVVKAVTYHDLKIIEGGTGTPWEATIVLDL